MNEMSSDRVHGSCGSHVSSLTQTTFNISFEPFIQMATVVDVTARDAEMFGSDNENGPTDIALVPQNDQDDQMADLFGDNDDEDEPRKETASLVHRLCGT